MSAVESRRGDDAFNVLRRFARRRPAVEQCEFCSQPVADGHQHLIEPPTRRLVCVCDACAILFPGGDQTKFKRVPREIRWLADFQISAAHWDSLRIPIEMAFFFESTPAGRVVAIYPSPAGPTESLLPLDTWQELVRDHPVVADLAPDVEALVANRLGLSRHEASGDAAAAEYFILPIDECFRLVGLMRLHWKGLSGGPDVWREIAGFFAGIRGRARAIGEAPRA